MNLVIFDIDGTITKTNPVDEACFRTTAKEIFDRKIDRIDFNEFNHVTDSAIVFELYQKYLDRNPSYDEYYEFRARFKKNLKKTLKDQSNSFEPVDGIQTLLHEIKARPKWAFIIATGSWRFSAKFKLESSGFYYKQLNVVTADEGLTRDRIVQKAIEMSKKENKVDSFKRMVYVGDATWDIKSCYNLNIPFIGIEAEENDKRKEELGNYLTMHQYPALKDFLKIAKQAKVPALPFVEPLFREKDNSKP